MKAYLNDPKNRRKDLPIVQFNNGIRETIFPDCRLTLLGDELPWTLVTRTQLPIMPAWAMTIHKSQGMTMDKVIADLSRAFETGQEYVALSRAKKLSGLKVVGLGSGLKSGGANGKVKEFLANQVWE